MSESSKPASSVAPGAEATEEERALWRARRFVARYTARGPYTLYPEPEVVENVVRGLASNLAEHGKMYCPCVPVESAKAKGNALVCPCVPHEEDIARQGHCDCALFASHGFVSAERLRRPSK